MNRLLLIIFLSGVLMACRTANLSSPHSEIESKIESCELLVKFKSDEALKRIMVKLENLRLEIVEEISASDHIHRIKLNCEADDLHGLIFKLNQQEGVEWVKSP